LDTLATAPPPRTIDWQSEYHRLYLHHKAAVEELAAERGALATLQSQPEPCVVLASRLSREFDSSFCVDLQVWDHNYAEPRVELEYRIYSAASTSHYGGKTLAEAEAKFREAIAPHDAKPRPAEAAVEAAVETEIPAIAEEFLP
jgi:hypothetical protein